MRSICTNTRLRTIDNSCKSMPTEADGVIGVTSVGPSTRKAYYSDYGLEQADVSAPGGDVRDTPDGSRKIENAVLAAYPKEVRPQCKTGSGFMRAYPRA